MNENWTAYLKPVPDAALHSEVARRRGSKPKSKYEGGLYWRKHNPNTSRCRCVACMERRQKHFPPRGSKS